MICLSRKKRRIRDIVADYSAAYDEIINSHNPYFHELHKLRTCNLIDLATAYDILEGWQYEDLHMPGRSRYRPGEQECINTRSGLNFAVPKLNYLYFRKKHPEYIYIPSFDIKVVLVTGNGKWKNIL